MKKLALLLLGCATVLHPAETPRPDKADPIAAGMDTASLAQIPIRMREFVDQGTAAGFVTLIARHGHIASIQAIGYQDLESKTPMRTDSIFRIKSMTKPITAAGVMILVDQGRISLLDPVEKYLPEFKGLKLNPCAIEKQSSCDLVSPSRLITVRDLLTHTAGLRDNAPQPAAPFHTLAEKVAAGAHLVLIAEPGTTWNYSNVGFQALGRIIEVASGQSYESFMAKYLFQRLGMKDTQYSLPAAMQGRLATLYRFDPSGKLIPAGPQPSDDSEIPGPDGGLFSTAADQAHFYQMLLDKGMFQGKRILSMAAVEAMTSNQTGDLKNVEFSPGLGMGFGYGVVKEPLGTYRYQSIGTFMKGGAYRTFAWGDRSRDLLGILLFQRTNGGGDTAPEINVFVALAEAAVAR